MAWLKPRLVWGRHGAALATRCPNLTPALGLAALAALVALVTTLVVVVAAAAAAVSVATVATAHAASPPH